MAMSYLNNMEPISNRRREYACNLEVDENEDHKPSIEKCTHTKK